MRRYIGFKLNAQVPNDAYTPWVLAFVSTEYPKHNNLDPMIKTAFPKELSCSDEHYNASGRGLTADSNCLQFYEFYPLTKGNGC